MYKEWEFNHDGALALPFRCDQIARAFNSGRKEALLCEPLQQGDVAVAGASGADGGVGRAGEVGAGGPRG